MSRVVALTAVELEELSDKAYKFMLAMKGAVSQREAAKRFAISKSSFNRYCKEQEQGKERGEKRKRGRKGLLTDGQIEVICDCVKRADRTHSGLDKRDILNMISAFAPDKSPKTIERYYDRTFCAKLKDYKVTNLVSAQVTTTKRMQVNLQQQQRWHTLVDDVFRFLEEKNGSCFTKASMAACTIGGDEASFWACDGKVKVHGCMSLKKHQKKTSNSRCTITMLRIGNAAGAQGPTGFVLKGKRQSKFTPAFLARHGAAPGSDVAVNDSAFMSNDTWRELAPSIASGIRQMPLLCDHPNW